jgi:hypothetical protein
MLHPILESILESSVARYSSRDALDEAIMVAWNKKDAVSTFQGENYRIAIENGIEAGWITNDGSGYFIVRPPDNLQNRIASKPLKQPIVQPEQRVAFPVSLMERVLLMQVYLQHATSEFISESVMRPDTQRNLQALIDKGLIHEIEDDHHFVQKLKELQADAMVEKWVRVNDALGDIIDLIQESIVVKYRITADGEALLHRMLLA